MLRLHNTLTRAKAPFEPQVAGQVSLYTCGPTVYDTAQIGNLRTYVFEDTLRRWLRYGQHLKVTQVLNITDVEDKILARSGASTVAEMVAWTQPFEEGFRADLAALNVESAESYPRPTNFIPAMITMIKAIMAQGFAYERSGAVYFDVQKYHAAQGYGQLLNIDFAGFADGHRIDNDEYEKDNVQDFALWKTALPSTPGWDSPWGYGRPGWHLECSVMAKAELGETIDIHTGAVDNIFPHHENEIAQSQAANGQPLARFWLHAEHLLVDGAKMAKSKQNFYTLADVTAQGFAPLDLRMVYLSAHYRSKLNFTWKSLQAAKESRRRIEDAMERLCQGAGSLSPDAGRHFEIGRVKADFGEALNDDLNTPEALAILFSWITDLNAALDSGDLGEAERLQSLELMAFMDQVLGVVHTAETAVPAAVQTLASQREKARQTGDFAESDRLREAIQAAGWHVNDTPEGPQLRLL